MAPRPCSALRGSCRTCRTLPAVHPPWVIPYLPYIPPYVNPWVIPAVQTCRTLDNRSRHRQSTPAVRQSVDHRRLFNPCSSDQSVQNWPFLPPGPSRLLPAVRGWTGTLDCTVWYFWSVMASPDVKARLFLIGPTADHPWYTGTGPPTDCSIRAVMDKLPET